MKYNMIYTAISLLLIFVFVCSVSDGVTAAGSNFHLKVYEVGYGRIVSIDAVNDSVEYNGDEVIFNIILYGNRTISNVVVLGNATYIPMYVDMDAPDNTTVYMYDLKFASDGGTAFIFYLSDGSAGEIMFYIRDSEYSYIDDETLANYTDMYNYAQDRVSEVEEIMGADYDDSPDGYNDAWLDVIDDSRALRQGPVYFGANMLMGLLMIFISPYSIIWIVLIIAAVMYSKRGTALAVEKMDKEREEMSIDTAGLALAAKMQQERGRALMGSTKKVASYLGIPAIIWRDIQRDYSTIGSICGAFDDTKFTEDGQMSGPIADSLAIWIRSALTMHSASFGSSGQRLDPERDYIKALRELLDYVVTELHYKNYEVYLKRLDKSSGFVNSIIKNAGPMHDGLKDGLSSEVANRVDKAGLDFSNLIDKMR